VLRFPLPALSGGFDARELVFTGREVGADEALRLGLVSSVVADDELGTEVERVTGLICRAPRAFLLRSKGKAIARASIDAGTPTLDL